MATADEDPRSARARAHDAAQRRAGPARVGERAHLRHPLSRLLPVRHHAARSGRRHRHRHAGRRRIRPHAAAVDEGGRRRRGRDLAHRRTAEAWYRNRSDDVGNIRNGEYTYRAVEGWAKWPEDWNLHDVAAVGVDRNDNVYAFHRGDHPMVVFDRNGNVLRTWGEGIFKRRARRAHGRRRHDLPDRRHRSHGAQAARSTARSCSPSASPGTPAPFMSGEPFRQCTHTALSPKGEIYVSDGYGNARVHKYSDDGKLRSCRGASPAPGRASSTCRTTSRAMPTAGSTSPIARIIACRCSTATAGSRRSGTTCIGRAGCTCRPASARSATSARSARTTSSIAARPTSGRG